MTARMTFDIPESLHDVLSQRAQGSGKSIEALILRAIEQSYGGREKGAYVTGPMVDGRGKLGPAFPRDENPHDLVLP